MSDFCKNCHDNMFGDLKYEPLSKNPEYKLDPFSILCEGCGGWVLLDINGNRLDDEILKPKDAEYIDSLYKDSQTLE